MELSEKQANERLNSPNNLANKLAEFRRNKKLQLDKEGGVLAVNSGRRLPYIPALVRTQIADKLLGGEITVKQASEQYQVSTGTISNIKRAAEKIQLEEYAFSQQEKENKREQFLIDAIKDQASEKMLLAMGLITPEKLEKLKATDLSRVAADLSRAISDVTPKNQTQGAAVNLVIYAPEVKPEDRYKIVEIQTFNE